MNFPAERSIPLRHRIAVVWVGFRPARLAMRATEFCGRCEKLALPSAEAARGYIALLMRSGPLTAETYTFNFAPYPCPHLPGIWHLGHNREVIEILAGKKRQTSDTRNLTPETCSKGTCHETEKENPARRRR